MYDQSSNALNQASRDRPMSRIDNDIANINSVTNRVMNTIPRIVRHATTLGYYTPAPSTAPGGIGAPLTPMTLADAIAALDRAVDELSGSLNLFD